MYTTTTSKTPMPMSPSWRLLILRSPRDVRDWIRCGRENRAWSCGQRLGHVDRFGDVDGHHPRNAGLGHGDADELVGHFHRALVVADVEELRARRHRLDHAR